MGVVGFTIETGPDRGMMEVKPVKANWKERMLLSRLSKMVQIDPRVKAY